MVIEDRIPLSTFALHQTDRDPETGVYGGDRILTKEYGDLVIQSYHVGQGIVRARRILDDKGPTFVFQLEPKDASSNKTLFFQTILARWEELRSDYEGSEDYTDYLPAFYANLQDLDNGKLRLVRDTAQFMEEDDT